MLTCFQIEVLRALFSVSDAILFAGGWVDERDVRRDSRLAEALYWEIVNPSRG